MRCSHYVNGVRCSAEATVRLVSPNGFKAGLLCREHANECITEYQQKLGQIWTVRFVNEFGDEIAPPTLIEQMATNAAQELGISEQDALTLAFCAMEAWAEIKGSNKARALFHLGAMHASGQMDGDTFHKCMALVK